MINLEWMTQIRPTVFHAAAGMSAGRSPLQAEWHEAMGNHCRQVANLLLANSVPLRPFWSHLIVLSAPHDALSQIVSTVIRKLRGVRGVHDPQIDAVAHEVSAIVQQATTHLISSTELQTRSQPLRQQWEAYGPGLMRLIADRTAEDLMVERCRVLLVQPIFGGAGAAHLDYNAVHLEAMLVNADDRLPECLRLAWLVAQLNHDLPKYCERLHRDRLPAVGGLAMLPVTLTAAEQLGLARLDRTTLLMAIDRWLPLPFHAESWPDHAQLADTIERWWNVCSSGDHTWPAALAALDQML